LGRSPGPDAGGDVLEWPGPADARKWIAHDGLNQVKGRQGDPPVR
jgi:hypothetical protein